MLLMLTLILTALAARGVRALAQDGGGCCNCRLNCKNVSTMNITMKEFAGRSPFYEPILAFDYLSDTYRSVCTTYFRVGGSIFIEFRSVQKNDGSVAISVTLFTDVLGKPGVFRAQGLLEGNSSIVYDAYVIDATCQNCQPLYMDYKCYDYTLCSYVGSEFNDVNGKSSSPDNAPSCLDAFESLAESKGFNVQGFNRPCGDSYSCVVQYGDAKCVNHDCVAPSNRIVYPQDGCQLVPL